MSGGAGPEQFEGGGAPSEEELRARIEEELKKVHVRDVLVQTLITLVNLGGQRLGLTAGTQDSRDLDQARMAIEAVRALLPIAEQGGAEELRPLRDALAQLQMAYAQEAGAGGQPTPEQGPPGAREPAEPPPPQGGQAPPRGRPSAGRLWVPPGSTE